MVQEAVAAVVAVAVDSAASEWVRASASASAALVMRPCRLRVVLWLERARKSLMSRLEEVMRELLRRFYAFSLALSPFLNGCDLVKHELAQ